jgi:AcrR family transcriptional regulator
MVRRTKQEAEATREHLLDTAEQVFLARGLSRSSLQDIADAAGLTRGAIYWHFADKPALFEAMMARVDLPLEQALATAESHAQRLPGSDPLDALRSLALEPFALMQRDPRARRVFTILLHRTEFVGELAPLAQRNEAAVSSCVQRMQRLFEAARGAGALAQGISPHIAATALLALIDGLLRLCTQREQDEGPAQAVAPAIDALLAGLRVRAG